MSLNALQFMTKGFTRPGRDRANLLSLAIQKSDKRISGRKKQVLGKVLLSHEHLGLSCQTAKEATTQSAGK